MDRNKIEWMLCQDQMRALLMDYMDVEDILTLGLLNKRVNAAINRESNWRYLFTSFYGYSWRRIFQSFYAEYYRCNHSYVMGGVYFVCTSAPVYKYTRCMKCRLSWHMCRNCAMREIQDRNMCETCDEWRGICFRCAAQPIMPYATTEPVFRTCADCNRVACGDHFTCLDGCKHWICDSCIDRIDFVYLGSEVRDVSKCSNGTHIIPPREVLINMPDLPAYEDHAIYDESVYDLV